MGFYSTIIFNGVVKTQLSEKEFNRRWEKAKEALIGTDIEGFLDQYSWERLKEDKNAYVFLPVEWFSKHYADEELCQFISEILAPDGRVIIEFLGEDGINWGYVVTPGRVDEIQYVKMVNGEPLIY